MSVMTVKEITGRHVFIGLAVFFGAMLLANGLFVYFALSTFQGVDNPNAYEEGLHYNKRIEAGRHQAALGWTHSITLYAADRIELQIKDRQDAPVSDLAVTGVLSRPVASGFTQPLNFHETGLGVYTARIERLQPGNWIVSLEAAKPHPPSSGTLYRVKERLWLKPNS